MAAINFSEEQGMLLDTAQEFCRNKSEIALVRARIADGAPHDAALWQEMVDLGWLGITVPEAHGGLGLSLAETVPIAESMGRYLLGSPFLATTLAIQTLLANGDDAQKERWLPELVTGAIGTVALTEEDGNWQLDDVAAAAAAESDDYVLTGTKSQVLDADAAALLIASVKLDGATRLVIVERDQLAADAVQRQVVIDETRASYAVSLDGARVSADQLLPGTNLDAIELAALLLISAEMSGGLAGVLHTIVEYLNTRKQFDRLIGSYQALKHPTVDILLAQEAAKSLVYHAASAVAEGDDRAAYTAIRMAKAHGSEAFAYAGDRAVQFHGGFGFTYECDAQLYLRRALWCQHQFGDERHHRQLLAPALLDAGALA